MILDATKLTGPVTDEADYVIVGTGAAGAVAARVLTESGAEVLLVEEGPYLAPAALGQGTAAALTGLFRDRGAQITSRPPYIAILQGCCVGGSTVINSGISWRPPEAVLGSWETDHGLAGVFPGDELESCFATIEQELSVKRTDEDRLGGNGLALRRGAEKLGLAHQPTLRTESGCEGSGRCLEGCTRARRKSMNHSYIPRALGAGARLYAGCRVDRVEVVGDRVRGVSGRFAAPVPRAPRYGFRAIARKAVLLAASAIHTPALLQRSGLHGSGQVGKHLQGHPGAAMIGVFGEPIRMWEGASQSYEVTQFRDRGIKIESLGLPPEMMAVRVPGMGEQLVSRLAGLDRLALAAVPVRARAQGTVTASGDSVRIDYTPTPEDVTLILDGLRHTGEIFFAAGASAVFPGIHGLPAELDRPADLRVLQEARVAPTALSWVMTHLMGTCRMGPDPATSVVGPTGEVHGVSGLYVIDSSLFPTNLGVNPQHTILAIAMLLTRRLAATSA
ncbi:MAG: GMC family oxidoreductase [Candidatus Riflebacteria bacterium]|nr:GMC family oxidoreductase [Candidatus Riflebacteria bacterium]